jgi:transglutaminase-like putative cysteine protease
MVRYGPLGGNGMMYFSGDEPLPGSVTATLAFHVELHRCAPPQAAENRPLTPGERRDLGAYLQTSEEEEGLKEAIAVLGERISREQNKAPLEAERDRLTAQLARLAGSNAGLREIAQGLVDQKLASRDQTRKVYDYVIEKLGVVETSPSPDRTLLEAWQSGKATELEYSRIVVFILRTMDIPARAEYGVLIPDKVGAEPVEIPGPHVWVGFFVPGQGWTPMDPVAALPNRQMSDYYFGTDCAGRIRFGWGSGIHLVPEQIGEPLPIFYEPRAEVDAKILPVTFKVWAADLVASPGRGAKTSKTSVPERTSK